MGCFYVWFICVHVILQEEASFHTFEYLIYCWEIQSSLLIVPREEKQSWKWSTCTAHNVLLCVSLHLRRCQATFRKSEAWSGSERFAAPECLGCGVMKSTSATAVQFTLGSTYERVCNHMSSRLMGVVRQQRENNFINFRVFIFSLPFTIYCSNWRVTKLLITVTLDYCFTPEIWSRCKFLLPVKDKYLSNIYGSERVECEGDLGQHGEKAPFCWKGPLWPLPLIRPGAHTLSKVTLIPARHAGKPAYP